MNPIHFLLNCPCFKSSKTCTGAQTHDFPLFDSGIFEFVNKSSPSWNQFPRGTEYELGQERAVDHLGRLS